MEHDSPIIAPPLLGRVMGFDTSDFMVAEWRADGNPPGPPLLIAPLHVHHKDDEAWYVLEGTLGFRLGQEIHEAPAGAGVFAPSGIPHTYWNAGQDPARYLLIMTPNTHRLIQEIHATVDRSLPTLRALFAKYDCELLEDS